MKYPMKCPECKYETESINVPIADGPPDMYCLTCTKSWSEPVFLRRVFMAAPAIFRGGGFYSTGG